MYRYLKPFAGQILTVLCLLFGFVGKGATVVGKAAPELPTGSRMQDSLALVALYDSTDGPNWSTTWDLNQPMDTWYGVIVNGAGRVTELNLRSNELTGNIPSALGNLSNLEWLYLDGNQLSGSIPSALGNLSNLLRLDLDRNQLSGSIPSALGNLSSLVFLDLDENQLTGSIPSALGNLSNLFRLDLDGNQLSGSIPEELGGLSNLQEFYASDNQLSGCFPASLLNLCGATVDFTNNPGLPGGGDFAAFCRSAAGSCSLICSSVISPVDGELLIDSLQPTLVWNNSLNATGYKISIGTSPGSGDVVNAVDVGQDTFYTPGTPLPNNATLYAQVIPYDAQGDRTDCAVTSFSTVSQTNPNLDSLILVALYQATDGPNWRTTWDLNQPMDTWYGVIVNGAGRVTELNLGFNDLTGNIPSALGNLSNLEWLYLDGNQLSGSIPSALGNLSNLLRLDLDRNQLSGSIPSALGNLSSLVFLYLDENELTGSIPSALGSLSNLGGLGLDRNQLSGSIPAELGNLSSLFFLYLDGNQLSGSIPEELGGLSNLQEFYASDNQLSGCFPASLLNLCGATVDFTNNPGLPGGGDFAAFCRSAAGSCSLICSSVISPVDGELLIDSLQPTLVWNSSPNATGYKISLGTSPGSGDVVNAVDVGQDTFYTPGTPLPNNATLYAQVIPYDAQGDRTDCAVTSFSTVSQTNPNLDSLILVALYDATDGPNWRTTWDLNQPMDTWHGVTVNGAGRVTELDLGSNDLFGSMPSALGSLSNLERLELDRNQLSGSIPSTLGNLSNLEELILFDNQLTGSIPSTLGNLSNLEVLILFDNQLTGSIPSTLSNLSNLLRLDLDINDLTGSIPAELGNLSNLELLYLNGNDLRSSIPAELGNLSNLELLYLFSNQLSGSIPSELGNLSNLEWLRLDGNQLSGSIPEELGGLSNLQEFYASDNQLSGCFPASLLNLCGATVDFTNNPGLPGGGDFAAFCSSAAGSCSLICSSVISPVDGGLLIDSLQPTLVWNNSPNATGYKISIGTSPGSGDVVNAVDVGQDTFYTPGTPLPNNATLYTQVIPYDAQGDRTDCPVTSFSTVSQTNPNLDSLILVALYHTTDGPNWRTTWDLNQPMDTWYGVTVNGAGRVTELNLGFNDLTGNIPSALGNLSNLERLELDRNQLSGSIPSALGSLSNLVWLDLGGNDLTGSIPPVLGNLSDLARLYLFSNNLNGSIPSTLVNLSNLEWLVLTGNDLTGGIPSALGNLSNLEWLDLGGNDLTGGIPSALGNLSNLEWLALGGNDLTGSIPSALGNLSNLLRLSLGGNDLTGNIPPVLGNLSNLKRLYLSSNNLNGSIPSALGNLSNLEWLALGGNDLTGSIPSALGNLSNLEWLDLDGNQLSGSIPQELGSLSNLWYFDARDNLLSGCIPATFSTVCGQSVFLSNNPGLLNGGDFNAFCATGAGSCSPLCPTTSDFLPLSGSVDVPVQPTLQWTPVPGAIGYELNVGTSPGGTEIVDGIDVGQDTFYVPDPLPGGTVIYVQVQPYDSDTISSNCLAFSFTTTAPDGVCQTSDLQLNQNPIPAVDHQTTQSITSSGTVEAGSSVTFQAGQTITLQPGFTAEAGSSFRAFIADCSPAQAAAKATDEVSDIVSSPTETQGDVQLSVFPNPFRGQFTVSYFLEQPTRLQMHLYSTQGRLVRTLIDGEARNTGTHTLEVNHTDLKPGMYVLLMQTAEGTYTRKVVKTR